MAMREVEVDEADDEGDDEVEVDDEGRWRLMMKVGGG